MNGSGRVILPGLTSTMKERIPSFLADMEKTVTRRIALFPTCLDPAERSALYRELELIENFSIPHVHLRSDAEEGEMEYLVERFGTEAFNIHPASSSHPFKDVPARFAKMTFVENVDTLPEEDELKTLGGICPDFSHWENALLFGRADLYLDFKRLLSLYPPACCHLSAVRESVPNKWAGEWDHHAYSLLEDLAYLGKYREWMPPRWLSLELENPLAEQQEAISYLNRLLRFP